MLGCAYWYGQIPPKYGWALVIAWLVCVRYVEGWMFEKNQILDMITCISNYYPGSYRKFSIYMGNTGSYPPNVDITILNKNWDAHDSSTSRAIMTCSSM